MEAAGDRAHARAHLPARRVRCVQLAPGACSPCSEDGVDGVHDVIALHAVRLDGASCRVPTACRMVPRHTAHAHMQWVSAAPAVGRQGAADQRTAAHITRWPARSRLSIEGGVVLPLRKRRAPGCRVGTLMEWSKVLRGEEPSHWLSRARGLCRLPYLTGVQHVTHVTSPASRHSSHATRTRSLGATRSTRTALALDLTSDVSQFQPGRAHMVSYVLDRDKRHPIRPPAIRRPGVPAPGRYPNARP